MTYAKRVVMNMQRQQSAVELDNGLLLLYS